MVGAALVIGDERIGPQALRYGLVGAVVWTADFAVYATSLWARPDAYLPANWLGKIAGAALGFALHKHVTYRWEQRDGVRRQLASYLALLGFNLVLSSGLLWMLVELAGANAVVSRVAVDGLTIAVAFLGSRLWVYRPR